MRCNNSQGPRILVAGLGNDLLRDDGVGVHVVRELQKNQLHGAIVLEVGSSVLSALHAIEWADKILAIDAMKAHGVPGTIYLSHDVRSIEEPERRASLHELNFLAVLSFIPPARQRRPDVLILGIEPETIDYGLTLSPSVQAAVPTAVSTVRVIVESWRNGGEAMDAIERQGQTSLE